MSQKVVGMTGDEAVAYAAKQSNVDVIAAYPITPQTIIVERLSEYYANGEIKAKYINVESEHSAMSGCIGASLAGARVFTATASQGLALMHETLYAASGLRCPIVMAVACRALSAPINIHGDHSDVMGSRDSGWIQIFTENPQEAYDVTLAAFKLAEKENVLTPAMVNLDGFITSHALERVEVLDDQTLASYLPPRKARMKLDPENPLTLGVFALYDYYFEFKRQQVEAMKEAHKEMTQIWTGFREISGRRYSNIRNYKLGDADVAVITMGSTSGTARYAVDKLRSIGVKAGSIAIRLFRPFPVKELRRALEGIKAVAVLDRAASFGAPMGPLYSDVAAVFYDVPRHPTIVDFVYGLGGRDITVDMIAHAA
ncbi:MAG: pyruvate ferredoxin oxidoreductase, partial [Nitrososphaeria archaeon]